MQPLIAVGRIARGPSGGRSPSPSDHDGEGGSERNRRQVEVTRNDDARVRQAGGRRLDALGDTRGAGHLRRRVSHRIRWWRRCRAPSRRARSARAAQHVISRRCPAGSSIRPAPVHRSGRQPDASRAASAGRPPGRDGDASRFPEAPRGKSRRLEGNLERADPARGCRSALAGGRRCRLLLPARLSALIVALQHLDVRPRLLAELPLLQRPRDVGHRELRLSHAVADGARGRSRTARLSLRTDAGSRKQRRHVRLSRPAVSLGGGAATRRGSHPPLSPTDRLRAARGSQHRPRLCSVRACHGRPGLPPGKSVAHPRGDCRLDYQPGAQDRSGLRGQRSHRGRRTNRPGRQQRLRQHGSGQSAFGGRRLCPAVRASRRRALGECRQALLPTGRPGGAVRQKPRSLRS